MVPFRGKTQLKPHPDWYLLRVHLKFPDKHPRPFYMGVLPGKYLEMFGEFFEIFREFFEIFRVFFENFIKTLFRPNLGI